ncbi:hypothetical protein ACFY2M_15740 [Streptomyces sp. NPDC001276]|uniref:hypothetical protein n=1 Tax=Streptomyces sp. NPDC001276 TaxID=3364555 RepID=UPI0036C03DE6
MTGHNTTSTRPPDGSHQQPRWAWWVVGIVIPIVGILVTVLVSRSGSSGDTSDKSAELAPTRSTESGAPEQPAETAGTVRAVPASGAAPTATQCAENVRTNSTYTTEVKPGDRFCLLTGEGRTAYRRVLAAPVQGTGRLEITVRDTPAARPPGVLRQHGHHAEPAGPRT